MAWEPDDATGISADASGNLTATSVTSSGAIVGPVRTNAADGTLTLAATDRYVLISSAGGSAPGATVTSAVAEGQEITIAMTAFDTNAYTVTVDEGTLTFNAADECATIFHDGTALRVVALRGATIV